MSYQEKVITVDQALALVKSHDHIVTGLGAGEAYDFLSRLHTLHDKGLKDIHVTNTLGQAYFEFFDPKYRDTFTIDGMFFDKHMRNAQKDSRAYYVPNHLHFYGTKRLNAMNPTIYVGSASWVDKHGFASLSCSNVYEKRMMEKADLVILEINKNFPRTFGDVEVHIDDVDYLIESSYPVPTLPDIEPQEKDMIIGKYIAEYIQDGDTIQLGIGAIPNAVADCLMDKKDLGIHTEMMTSNMAKLVKKGVVTGKRKTLHPEKHVATFILGNQELYDWVDDNPSVLILDAFYVNNPKIIAQNDNMVSINTAIEVDLWGQVASEAIGPRQFSGSGGQSDTAVGAQDAKNGRSFIALYSTQMVRQEGKEERVEISKIVSSLKPGSIVTLSRNDVDYVVTEYGVAHLRGFNVAERMEKLIAIAHPKFRDQLRQEAIAMGVLEK